MSCYFIKFLDFLLILLHRFHSLAEGSGLLDERLCCIIMISQPFNKGFSVSKCLLNGAAHFSVPGRTSGRARREEARLRGSPTRVVIPLRFSPPGATTTREVECPRSGLRALAAPAQRADAQSCSHSGGTYGKPTRLGPIPGGPEPPRPAAAERQASRDFPLLVPEGPTPGKRLAVDWRTGRGRGFSPRPPLKVLLCRSHTLACFPRGYRLGLKAERGGWVGRLCLSRAEAGLSRPWLSTLWGDLSGRPDRSSLRLIGNKC